jgi:hypothetical protein
MRSVTVSLIEPHPRHVVALEVFVFRAEQIVRIEKPEMAPTMFTTHTALHKTVDSRASFEVAAYTAQIRIRHGLTDFRDRTVDGDSCVRTFRMVCAPAIRILTCENAALRPSQRDCDAHGIDVHSGRLSVRSPRG